MITCFNVAKKYANNKGIINFDNTFAAGEIVCILGKNGAGKTTLLNILSGIDSSYSGTVYFDNKDIRDVDFYKYRRNVSFLPTEEYLFDELTIKENLQYISKLKTGDKDEWLKNRDLIHQLGVEEYLSYNIRSLSFGNIRKAHLLASLITPPQYIIWDEPHNGMDISSNTRINNLLVDYKCKQATIIISTHILELAAAIADRIILIDQGKEYRNINVHDEGIKSVSDYFNELQI